jgi:hypothetical protein
MRNFRKKEMRSKESYATRKQTKVVEYLNSIQNSLIPYQCNKCNNQVKMIASEDDKFCSLCLKIGRISKLVAISK